MSSSVERPLSFRQVIGSLDLSPLFLIDAQSLASGLQNRLRLATKYISRATQVPRNRAYDAISCAASFADWHQLSEHISLPAKSQNGSLPRWSDALIPLLPLLVKEHAGTAPGPEAARLIEQFWRRVAHELAVPSALILNDVGAQMIGERSWSALLARSPIKASEPFYRFLPDPSNNAGHFQLSLPGYALADELNSLTDMGREPNPEELAEAEEWARSITVRRPDFLDAGLFLAELVAINNTSEASKILDVYIARSEALIPTEFRGKIDWLYDGNRTYLRMLYLRMEMAHQTADIARSIKLARKLLKLCPDDNQGVRYVLPLLLLMKGNISSATRSIRTFARERGYIGAPIRAFVAYANGDIKSFRENLLEALFYWPGFRRFVEGNPSEFGQPDTDRRGQIVDMEEFAQLAWPVLVGIPGLKQASIAVVRHDQVRLAEARLRDLWQGFFRNPTPSSSHEQWSKSVDYYINVLS